MVPYGGFWWRVLAYIIDIIVLQILWGVVGTVFGIGIGINAALTDPEDMYVFGPMLFGMVGASLVINWLYFALMESSKFQATLGKLAIGLVVTDLEGQRLGFGRATGRYFGKILSSMIMGIGYLMVAFTGRKQGLHDMIAGTLVYKTRDPSEVAEGAEVFA